MTWVHLILEQLGGVGIVTLNRPEKLNALNRLMSHEIHRAVQLLAANVEIGCIVITGSGDRAFSAGGDIHEQVEMTSAESSEESTRNRRSIDASRFDLGTCPKPTIGMINGLAYGGAAGLAASLDIRTGCEHASFKFLAATYGQVNSTWSLPNQVSLPIAKELLFTGRSVGAQEAKEIGLLNHLVSCLDLRAFTLDLASTIATNNHHAVQATKSLLQDGQGRTLLEKWQAEVSQRESPESVLPESAFDTFLNRERDSHD